MLSQRRIAQLGIIAASAVFVVSIGILMSQAGDASDNKNVSQQSSFQHINSAQPMTLSAPAASESVASR
jgi:hypothetical protein